MPATTAQPCKANNTRRICAWCQRPMETVVRPCTMFDYSLSHGMCSRCKQSLQTKRTYNGRSEHHA